MQLELRLRHAFLDQMFELPQGGPKREDPGLVRNRTDPDLEDLPPARHVLRRLLSCPPRGSARCRNSRRSSTRAPRGSPGRGGCWNCGARRARNSPPPARTNPAAPRERRSGNPMLIAVAGASFSTIVTRNPVRRRGAGAEPPAAAPAGSVARSAASSSSTAASYPPPMPDHNVLPGVVLA